MPSEETFAQAERRPDLRLGGCCITSSAWATECVTCGQRQRLGASDQSEWTTASRPETARLITAYAASARQALDTAQTSAISYCGLWLLLARLAPVATGSDRVRLEDVLGVSCEEAAEVAARLLDAPHPTIAAAVGAWSRSPATTLPGLVLDELPGQAGLDRWASARTRGLIERFPLEINPLTELVLATALVLQPRWTTEMRTDDNGLLVLEEGLQAIVSTRAAGLVAVAKPFSEDGVDVVSVIAAPDVPPSDVWRAVDEIVGKLNEGGLWQGQLPDAGSAGGHAWTVCEATEEFVEWDAPDEGDYLWRSHLPRWSAKVESELTAAPGVAEVVASPREAVPALAGPVECVQAATAAYDENGFQAAAVTALLMATGAPQFVERTIHRVDVTFDRPHAVVAVARGGAWEGVPLFHCWVTPSCEAPARSADRAGSAEANFKVRKGLTRDLQANSRTPLVFGEIEELRRRGLNQSEIAAMHGVSRQAVSWQKKTYGGMLTPRQLVQKEWPWETTSLHGKSKAFQRLRDHGEFMVTAGGGMSEDKLQRLKSWWRTLRRQDVVLEFDPSTPPHPGLSPYGGFAYMKRVVEDDDLLIRVNEFTRTDDAGRLSASAAAMWRWPDNIDDLLRDSRG